MRFTSLIGLVLSLLVLTGCTTREVHGHTFTIPAYPHTFERQEWPFADTGLQRKKTIHFRTDDSSAAVTMFYQERLLVNGWHRDRDQLEYVEFSNNRGCPIYTVRLFFRIDTAGHTVVDILLIASDCF